MNVYLLLQTLAIANERSLIILPLFLLVVSKHD